jgi:hypothetical protein
MRTFLLRKPMRGKDDRSEILFSYIRLDERIPADHPLRVIRQLVDAALAELSRAFAKLYARDGRPGGRGGRHPAGTVDGTPSETHLDLGAREAVRNAIKVPLDIDVIIDADTAKSSGKGARRSLLFALPAKRELTMRQLRYSFR